MGGSIVFLKTESIDKVWMTSALALLFIAFLGILPHESNITFSD
jgi:hypothetical protein